MLTKAFKIVIGGKEGIRTLDTLFTYTRFPGVRLQPLIHLSKGSEIIRIFISLRKTRAIVLIIASNVPLDNALAQVLYRLNGYAHSSCLQGLIPDTHHRQLNH